MPASMHEVFAHPENQSTQLWRYMDFTKFVSMLDHGGLYLCRADLLGDPFEGSVPKITHDSFRAMLEKLTPGKPAMNFSEVRRQLRKVVYLSCWHMSEGESVAMWSLYSKSDEAIAIQTNFSSLFNSVDSDDKTDSYYVGLVNYIDYANAHIPTENMLWPFVYKRRSYEHEHEVRLVQVNFKQLPEKLSDTVDSPPGIWVTVDLRRLIHKIYVSPTSQDWFRDLVESVARKFEYNHRVLRSNLATEPLF